MTAATTHLNRRTFLQAAGYSALYGSLAADFAKSAQALTPKEIASEDLDLHLLRRISFGPIAQELARVRQIGRDAYIDEQLNATDGNADLVAAAMYPNIALPALGIFTATAGGFSIDTAIAELQSAMIYRALFSTAQLHEVMTDFWNDHFNTYIKKNPIPLKLCLDHDVIRVHALGNFKTLLRAVVHHPEMLYYLDNWMNAVGAVNENYARELLELHTLGKDGGYTEADMKALALILTGLSYPIDPAAGMVVNYGNYSFDPARHHNGEKTFLGQHFPVGGGENEINRALDLILEHPGTARHIAEKLCRRFVSDQPPDSLVTRVAALFTSSDGDIKTMMREILRSPEFAASAGQKLKRPQQAIFSAARACGVNIYDYVANTDLFGTPGAGGGVIFQALVSAGQVPFGWVPPNGYPDSNAYWGNTNSLLYQERFLVRLSETMSYARALADPLAFAQQGNSTAANVAKAKTPRQAVQNAIANLLFTTLPESSVQAAVAFVAQQDDPDAEVEPGQLELRIKGLVFVLLSSPWFMLR